jgi:hypothetical protein
MTDNHTYGCQWQSTPPPPFDKDAKRYAGNVPILLFRGGAQWNEQLTKTRLMVSQNSIERSFFFGLKNKKMRLKNESHLL